METYVIPKGKYIVDEINEDTVSLNPKSKTFYDGVIEEAHQVTQDFLDEKLKGDELKNAYTSLFEKIKGNYGKIKTDKEAKWINKEMLRFRTMFIEKYKEVLTFKLPSSKHLRNLEKEIFIQ